MKTTIVTFIPKVITLPDGVVVDQSVTLRECLLTAPHGGFTTKELLSVIELWRKIEPQTASGVIRTTADEWGLVLSRVDAMRWHLTAALAGAATQFIVDVINAPVSQVDDNTPDPAPLA